MNLQFNNAYSACAGKAHQKKFAQYFTPPSVADFMVRWLLHENPNREIYDPAFGLGAFFYEVPDDVHFYGMEIDPCILRFFENSSAKNEAAVVCGDYLLNFGEKHHCIVCNPPYLKFQKIENRRTVFNLFQEKLGIVLSGYTNIASAFLVKSLRELSDDGRLAYIMPYEFLNAGYGTIVKKLLLDHHTCSIIRLNCEKDVFPDATTSVCIILYDKSRCYDSLRFYSIDKLQDLESYDSMSPASTREISLLDPETKWGIYFDNTHQIRTNGEIEWVPLKYYGHFSRGIATGANEFFSLSSSDVRRLNLSKEDYFICISKSSQITSPVLQYSNVKELIDNDGKIFLFSPQENISESANEYIRWGEGKEYHKRYLLCHRKPWYKTEIRECPSMFLNVFSRGSYKVIKNEAAARSLTCYHNFYPNLLAVHLTDTLFLFLYSTIGHAVLAHFQRQYGDHLNKFEPNDLNDAMIPSEDYFQKIDPNHVMRLLDDLRYGKDVLPQADALFSDLIHPS